VIGALFLLIAIVTTFLVYQQQLMSKKIERSYSQAINERDTRPQLKVNPDLERQLSVARQTQRSLNVHWEIMLSALEQVQQENPSVKLLSIQPQPEKGQVLIAGEVSEFDALIKYLNKLRQQPSLGDAMLLNHHWEQSINAENAVAYDKLVFNLSVIWLP
jgi:hypothetical protein